MKKHDIIFGIIRLPLDFFIIFSSFFVAREIRAVPDLLPIWLNLPIKTIDNESLALFAIFGGFLYLFILSIHSLYLLKITSSKINEFLQIIRYSFYWMIFFSFFVFLGKGIVYQTDIPRLIIFYTFLIGTIGVILGRILLNNFEYFLLRKGILSKRKLLLISNKLPEKISEIIDDINDSKVYKIIGYSNKEKIENNSLRYKGNIEKIKILFEKKKCDEILYIDSDYNKKELHELWELTRIFAVRYRYITNSFDVTKTNTTLTLINKIPVIEIKNTSLDNWAKVFKRIFDLFAGIIGIILTSPLILIVGILIKIEDPKGPVFYKNSRIGKSGKRFNLYKFRYMKWEYCIKDAYTKINKNDEALLFEKELIEKSSSRNGPLYKIKDDPRKTKIGNFIEKYSIDEIPQFFNLIIGNMSLVGPRPHQPREVEKYSIDQKRLLTIKPGITGMAQVNGRETNDFKKEAELDIFYIENWNMLLDMKIILKTFSVILSRK
ncbi:MAG: sugar transferase [Candidatus Gracilibacteria bacterium]|nr:sugar transferase [Candidatus Gracilibacteria bacterium]